MSIHDRPEKRVFVTEDGQHHEFTTKVDGNAYLPLYLAMDSWLQEITLDDAVNLWWRAQRRRNDEQHRRALLREAGGGEGD